MESSSFSYRIEHDSLGDVRVPADALFGAQTQRAVENFHISGLRPRRAFIWSIALIKQAAAQVNCELGLLDPNFADAIINACQEILSGQWDNHFVVDPFQAGAGTSHHMNANEVIANRATQMLGGSLGQYLVHPNDHVNLAQSTNDVIPTAIRLGCLWRMDELVQAVNSLALALQEKSIEFQGILKSGRTHLQDAVPISLGQEFSGYASAVEQDRNRIQHTTEGLCRIGIGGTAAGTGLNAHPEYHARMVKRLSELTGQALYSSGNLFESMQSMADLVDFSAAMRTLAVTLTRIANDLRLLASGPATGLDEIRMPAVQPGSSIMPGKINPVMAEMLNMAMFQVIGCDGVVTLAAQAGQLELNVMMPVIACNLFDMQQIMIASILAFTRKCVTGIQANPAKAAHWLEHNTIVATALNPLIGYATGAALVKEAQERNLTIHDLAVEKAQLGLLVHRQDGEKVTVEEIEAALTDLKRMTEGGIFLG